MEGQRYFSEIINMQIFYFSNTVGILLSIVFWGFFQVLSATICYKLPDYFFNYNSFLFRPKTLEKNGEIYKSLFKIHKWKKFLPDGAAIIKFGYKKRNMTDFSKQNLNQFLTESCRAELGHLLSITPFWVFGFFLPPISIPIMFVYALIINIPCILAQRYNRPRILKLLQKKKV